MFNSTSRIAGFLGALMIGSGVFGVNHVAAQTNAPKTSFIRELAHKLGIDQSRVQSAVDEITKERKSSMEKRFDQILDQALKDGKITEAQKQLILQKRQELQNLKSDFKNITSEQRREAMKNQRQALEDWAKQNNIDLKFVLGAHGHLGAFKGRWGKH